MFQIPKIIGHILVGHLQAPRNGCKPGVIFIQLENIDFTTMNIYLRVGGKTKNS